MKKVYTIPPDAPFVDALADGLVREAGDGPFSVSDSLILLPTRRACLHLREAFRKRLKKAALLPRMQPIGDIDEDELYFTDVNFDIPPAIAPLRRQLLLANMISKIHDMQIDQAALLAEALAKLLDEMQIERRNFSGLEQLVERHDLAEHWKETVEFLKILTKNWPDILADEGSIDPADRRNRVLEAQATAWRASPPATRVIAAGSTGSMPATADLLEVVANLPQGAVILPGLDQRLDEAAWQEIEEAHPQYTMKNLLEKFGLSRADVKVWGKDTRSPRVRLLQESMRPAEVSETWRELKPADIPADALQDFTRIELDHPQEEAQAIALMMREALEKPGKTAALITPDRPLAERVIALLARWGIRVNDSAGTALSSLPLGGFLIDVLKAATPNASPVEMLALFKHPSTARGLAPAVCRAQARKIELEIFRNQGRSGSPPLEGGVSGGVGSTKVELRDYGENPPPSLPLKGGGIPAAHTEPAHLWLQQFRHILQPLTESWRKKLPLVERIQEHIRIAEKIAATDEESGASRLWRGEEGEAAADWLNDLQAAAEGFPALNGSDYIELLAGFMRGVKIRPVWGLHPRLSILGPLEARLIHYDLMILGGLNEGVWPAQAQADPWMSRPMKSAFKLPLPELRIGLSAHDFVQLASAPEVVLTRSSRREGSPSVPSRFLLQLETVLRAAGHPDDALTPKQPWREWARMLDMPTEPSAAMPRPEPRPPAELRPKEMSVTDIGLWRRNPYAIYAKYILKLKKLDPLEISPDASDRGSIIHDVLDAFVKKYPDALPTSALEELLAMGRKVFDTYQDHPEVHAFWWPRFERIAEWFVENEGERRAAGTMPLRSEARGQIALGPFKLKGRADRIDRKPDGTLAIGDYKTGHVPSKAEVDAGYEPQLSLLGLIAERGGFEGVEQAKVSELAYWRLNGGNKGSEIEERGKDPAALAEKARQGLEQLIATFADPGMPYRAAPDPDLQPKYDDYTHLARLQEWGRFEEDS